MTWLIVGLGNPGKEYASHRHNVGFMAAEELASAVRAGDFRDKFSGRFTKASHQGDDIVILEPLTFMNLSGQSVQPAAAFFKVEPARVVVIHDELDLPFGEVRLKVGGGHAGHNGLRSIMKSMGTGDFVRLRIGIGRPPPGFRGEVADYVLSSFDAIERAELAGILKRATESVLDVCARGVTAAMNKLNTKPKPTPRSGDLGA
jgi:PTH1 family peptidyl-tRNA hydrolase